MAEFSEEEVTAGVQALAGNCKKVARAVLEASGAVPRGEYERVRLALSAYRSAVRCGERESDQLRLMGDAALSRPDTPHSRQEDE